MAHIYDVTLQMPAQGLRGLCFFVAGLQDYCFVPILPLILLFPITPGFFFDAKSRFMTKYSSQLERAPYGLFLCNLYESQRKTSGRQCLVDLQRIANGEGNGKRKGIGGTVRPQVLPVVPGRRQDAGRRLL